ncbi:FG-GAP-like repeat-containing protein [Hymenobacter edaphi]|uniref:SbsA Ig-like domain-containing protein n=1 Tax=Hymenobacter edaphi TaxID=2211146 RepID=A0A328B9P7_9BACT|nr:FG-GAP-like repeat-containing protein [Hymenobacter edaphi]RAK64052.1 hypothetical protein DLM85_19095 [Hymenobacter edaphi]
MKPLVLLCAGLLPAAPLLAQSFAVTGLNPTRNAVAVPRSTSISVTMSQPLATPAAGALRVFSSQRGGRLAGALAASGNTLSFAGARAFKPGETLLATLTTTARSAGGSALSTPQVWQVTASVQGGTGQFGGGAEVAVGAGPGSLATGDVDDDGDLDVVVANTGTYTTPGNTVSLRLNDGLGRFSPPATGAELTVGSYVQHVTLGDVDADGDLDLLTANFNSNTVSVRLGNGRGQFAAPATGAEVAVNVPAHVGLADIDGDGDLDLLVVNGIYSAAASGSVSIRLNDGTGQFAAPAANAVVPAGNGPYSLVVGDVDNDGDLDLLVPNDGASYGNGTVSVRLNTGAGVFAAPTPGAEVPLFPGVDDAVAGDVDNDGDLDLLAVNYGGPTSVGSLVGFRLNNGAGQFTAPGASASITVGRGPRSLALGDIDGDGDLDLLVANTGVGTVGTTLSVRVNDQVSSGSFGAPATGAELTVGSSPRAVTLADVDGDGDLDVLCANAGSNTCSVRLNGGTGAALAAAAPRGSRVLALYPNPARELVRVPLPAPAREVTLRNALGQRVRTVAVAPAATEAILPLHDLPAGVYLVQAGGASSRLVVE